MPNKKYALNSEQHLTTSFYGIQYSQVCRRVIGYQVGHPQTFFSNLNIIDGSYVDGVRLTYGSPQQHIWTFAALLDEYPYLLFSKCPCTNANEQYTINTPSFVGDDCFL